MDIGEHGTAERVSFWPADEIAAAFERVNAATGGENEIEEMRLFVRAMNYFYEQASCINIEMSREETDEICRLAKKGLYMELGLKPEGTAS